MQPDTFETRWSLSKEPTSLSITRQPPSFSCKSKPFPHTSRTSASAALSPISPAISMSSPPSDLADRRAALLEKERSVTIALSAIRSQLNELLPISWIPTEVLEVIFGICVSWLYGHQKPKYRLAWTQVYRRWRQISLQSPRLWQCIDLCDSRFAHEFLARSKDAPISIVSASPLKLHTENLHNHAERLQSIDVFLFPDDMENLFASVGTNLGSLVNLSLKIPPIALGLTIDIPFPSVRRLVLESVAIQWQSCRDLTELSLRSLGAELSPSLSQLRAILRSSPMLEHLVLEYVNPSLLGGDTNPGPIPLPHLREMQLAGKTNIISSVLDDFHIPSTARLSLNCSFFHDLQSLFPSGLPYDRSSATPPFTTALRLARHAVYFLTSAIKPWSDHTESSISITATSCISEPVLSTLPDLLDLSHVTVMELNTGVLADMHSLSVIGFLDRMPNLLTLRVAFNNLDKLFAALDTPPGQNTICPRLETISFSRPGEIWWQFSDRWLQAVLKLATNRFKNAAPLKCLEFFHCHGIAPDVPVKMAGIVPDIRIVEPLNAQLESRSIGNPLQAFELGVLGY